MSDCCDTKNAGVAAASFDLTQVRHVESAAACKAVERQPQVPPTLADTLTERDEYGVPRLR